MLKNNTLNILITEPTSYALKAQRVYAALGTLELSRNKNWTKGNTYTNVLVVRLRFKLTADLLQRFPKLQYVITPTTGLNHIDQDYCQKKQINILSLKGERRFLNSIYATAEHTIALILSMVRKIPAATQHVQNKEWNRDLFIGEELHGKTLGIIGMGRIGTQVAQIAKAFGMKIIYYDPLIDPKLPKTKRCSNLLELLQQGDIITIHVPHEQQNINLLNEDNIKYIKPSTYLINTSRGEIVREEAIAKAIIDRKLAGYATDVLTKEYNRKNNGSDKLIRLMQEGHPVMITPHIGGATHDSMRRTEIFMAHKLQKIVKDANNK